MRKVFLENLPKRGKLIDWKNSIGLAINFIYNNLNGNFEITGYNPVNNKVKLRYLNAEEYEIFTGHLKECKISFIIGMRNRDFLYNTGDIVLDENRSLTITDFSNRKIKGKPYKMYKYKCNNCGFDCGEHYKNGIYYDEMWIYEGNLKKGRGCPVCSCNSKAVKLGINTIWDTDRWMVDLGVSEEDAKRYTRCSDKKVVVSCPHCGNRKNIKIVDIYGNKSIGCTCGDKVSYPEKFIISMLNQLNIKFVTQLSKSTFNWCKNYRYDFYLPDYNMIIETHGMQHYKNVKTWNKNIKEIQDNDKLKRDNAINNGIGIYIELDCRYSNIEYIKNSVLNSELNNNIFNVDKVDWLKCEAFALSNLLKKICNNWDKREESESVNDFSRKFNMSNTTIREYLKTGNMYGFCEYNPKEETKKGIVKSHKNQSRQLIVFKNLVKVGVYDNVNYFLKNSKQILGVEFTQSGISLACRKETPYKGFTFKYI